ncbi:hypothetical protein JTE90_022259 [Oedothorax gibbosus]|uniref:Uncharacterized protein n=1 Tax=Oedothorax gibbosus TaxID=931172 RepID=A0AAV6VUM4_9ARAC|nr:hypothetical protein JTE90_022259 [Oedothorax gibbosus]
MQKRQEEKVNNKAEKSRRALSGLRLIPFANTNGVAPVASCVLAQPLWNILPTLDSAAPSHLFTRALRLFFQGRNG